MSRKLKIVVAGTSPQGEPDWFFVKVEVPEDFDIEDENEIRHLMTAMRHARKEGWGPIQAFDETCPPFDLMKIAGQWGTFPILQLDEEDMARDVELIGAIAVNAIEPLTNQDGIYFTKELIQKLRICLAALEDSLP